MHTNEERIAAMHRRANELEREKRNRISFEAGAVSVVLCFAAVIALALYMPTLTDTGVVAHEEGSLYASILIRSGALGYVVIGIISFLLGVSVTVFCFRLKKWRDGKAAEDDHD